MDIYTYIKLFLLTVSFGWVLFNWLYTLANKFSVNPDKVCRKCVTFWTGIIVVSLYYFTLVPSDIFDIICVSSLAAYTNNILEDYDL